MDIINPNNPVYNTVIFYILINSVFLLVKPNFMYCNKINKFKTFGCNKNQTLFPFPLISIGSAVLLYIIFLCIKIVNDKLK